MTFGDAYDNGWSYDPGQNAVLFWGDAIRFQPRCGDFLPPDRRQSPQPPARPMKKLLCAFAALLGATPAFAQNAVDVGVIKNEDVKIVQKLLYRADRLEYGAHLGVMPFDAYTLTPTFAATIAKHFREDMGVEATLMGGYGFKSSTYKELESSLWRGSRCLRLPR